MAHSHSDHDPLLAFSTEGGAAPVPLPPSSPPVEPVASPAVRDAALVKQSSNDEVERLRARIDRLEKTVTQSAADLAKLRSEVATLVAALADIRKRTGRAAPHVPTSATRVSLRRAARLASAIVGVILGVAAGMWFWMNTGREPLAPVAPIPIASEPLPLPEPAVDAPATQPAIVPAAVMTPVSDAPARVTRTRVTPGRIDYVGTLSIDSDPAADVMVDRQPAGRTPLRIADLKAGSHLIWIERDGYQRFTRVVQVPADRVSRVVATLEPNASR